MGGAQTRYESPYLYLAFISHCKADASMAAIFFKQALSSHAGRRNHPKLRHEFFLDADDLHDLEKLLQAVKDSGNLLVLLSQNYLSRPWCLLELWKAVSEGINLVPVTLAQAGSFPFDFKTARIYADALRSAPGIDREVLGLFNSQGATVEEVQSAVGRLLGIIASPFDAAAAENVRDAQLHNIFEKMLRKKSPAAVWSDTSKGTSIPAHASRLPKEAGAAAGGAGNSDKAKALVGQGWDSTRAGRHEEARARFAEAAALAPGLARAHFGLGYVLVDKLGRLEEGIAAYRRALELDPKDADTHNNLGFALKAQDDLAGAVASYRRALELDPEYAHAHNNLGLALKAQDDLAGAVASYRRALELDPEHAHAHNNLGGALKAQGDLAGAVASYRRALELDPEYAHAHNNLGLALKAQKDLPGAEAAYRRALEARPDHADALGNLGALLRERGGAARLREAEDLLRRAVALDPGSAIKRWNLGLVLEEKSDWAGAEAQFREGMALDPKDPDYARAVGEMRRKQGLEG